MRSGLGSPHIGASYAPVNGYIMRLMKSHTVLPLSVIVLSFILVACGGQAPAPTPFETTQALATRSAEPTASPMLTPTSIPNPVLDLSGIWESSDYQCPFGTFHTEKISIQHTNNHLVARKITGDPCVPAGDITFEGSFSEDTNSLLMTVGLPPEPSSGKIPVQISLIDHNSFHINGLLFVRQVGAKVNLDIIGSNGERTPTYYHHWGASSGSHIAGPTEG